MEIDGASSQNPASDSLVFPILSLQIGTHSAVAASGRHVHVFNIETGAVLSPILPLHEGPIRFLAVDFDSHIAVTIGDDKKLKVWKLNTLELLSTREIPKKATGVSLTKDGKIILVRDKFGDLFSYETFPVTIPDKKPSVDPSEPLKPKREGVASHENEAGGQLVLGHASMITASLLTPDEKYIITADRDEHVRVSWFPLGWNVERFCLGHERFVSSLALSASDTSILYSTGGEPFIYVWSHLSGRLLSKFPLPETLLHSTETSLVKGGRARWKAIERAINAKEWKAKNKKKVKGKSEADVPKAEEPSQPDAKLENLPPVEDSLVITNLSSWMVGDGEELRELVVFSALGSSSVFYVSSKGSLAASSALSPHLQSINLHSPVIDITRSDDGKTVWATLDPSWRVSSSRGVLPVAPFDDGGKPVLAVRLDWNGSEFVNSKLASPLLDALNSQCGHGATSVSLVALDLYVDLVGLPKSLDEENDDDNEAQPSHKKERRTTTAEGEDSTEMDVDSAEDVRVDSGRRTGARAAMRAKFKDKLERAKNFVQGDEPREEGREDGSPNKKARLDA